MGYKTRVQLVNRKKSRQWYVNFPSALAQALELAKSEEVEWVIESRDELILRRQPRRPRRPPRRAAPGGKGRGTEG
jgi:antitoxin component of MazEF toxin-antitoxin module